MGSRREGPAYSARLERAPPRPWPKLEVVIVHHGAEGAAAANPGLASASSRRRAPRFGLNREGPTAAAPDGTPAMVRPRRVSRLVRGLAAVSPTVVPLTLPQQPALREERRRLFSSPSPQPLHQSLCGPSTLPAGAAAARAAIGMSCEAFGPPIGRARTPTPAKRSLPRNPALAALPAHSISTGNLPRGYAPPSERPSPSNLGPPNRRTDDPVSRRP